MDAFLKMDIFFFVATIAVIVCATVLAYVLWRVARILRNVEHVSEQFALESDTIRQDLAEMRGNIRRGKSHFRSLFDFLGKTTKRAAKKH